MMQVKGAGLQSTPAPAHTAPQCGSGNGFSQGRDFADGVVTGVYKLQDPHLSRNI